jgi:hypothetical protein
MLIAVRGPGQWITESHRLKNAKRGSAISSQRWIHNTHLSCTSTSLETGCSSSRGHLPRESGRVQSRPTTISKARSASARTTGQFQEASERCPRGAEASSVHRSAPVRGASEQAQGMSPRSAGGSGSTQRTPARRSRAKRGAVFFPFDDRDSHRHRDPTNRPERSSSKVPDATGYSGAPSRRLEAHRVDGSLEAGARDCGAVLASPQAHSHRTLCGHFHYCDRPRL